MGKTLKAKISKIVLTAFLALLGLTMVLPLLWMISGSFKYESDVFNVPMQWIPERVNLDNYVNAVTKFPYVQWYLNTFKVTIWVVVLTLLVSSLAGYAFAKLNFKGKKIIFTLFIATLMIPVQVRLIPQFILFKYLDVINKHASVILPWAYNGFAIFLMRQFFMSVPNELIEAARIDGCNEYRTFWQVVLPLAKPSLVALTVLSFTWGWNFYLGPLIYIRDINKQLLSVGIATFKAQYASNYAAQLAGSTLALLPIIIVYLIAQKYFIEGVALSGIKG